MEDKRRVIAGYFDHTLLKALRQKKILKTYAEKQKKCIRILYA